ncbi:PREDICTED: uncharacterized protein LOC109354749 isoform X1 [Lupinus angustifolius]|uniref:uncharacterized protein LOC109354749 isoform X1 n=1 Tax=Lupinus angustifolius TaxID=3871 RepID=UPI00092EDC7A|nr:PREDICTED: uncharacterized protein LOC109354749 isoform X1 [Lupinus angustifolius]
MGFEDQATVQKSKRTTNPGIRIIGNRIYDSANGKTCHQCRQKTTDFAASCKNERKGKPCPIKFCQKCLFNRYGEEAEQVDLLSDWKCPKCRGKCNCSCCRKKQGLVPTGQLVKTAKASGYKSVDELLHNASNFSVSPMDEVTLGLESVLSVEAEKENSLDGNSSFKVDTLKNQKKSPEISKKTKREGLVEISNVNGVDGACESRSKKKSKICNKVPEEESKQIANGGTELLHEVHEMEMKEARDSDIVGENDDPKKLVANYFAVIAEKEKIEEVPLPPGTTLEDIMGIEFDPEDIGSALQLLEFCKVFGKALDVKKGEAEAVLREMVRKKSMRRAENTLAIQFHIKLLTVILTDSGISSPSLTTNNGKNSWLKALEDLISDESLVLKEFPLDWINEGINGYHNLDLSKKLMLLNFLCDEALGTETLRNYMDEQNLVFSEETKEAKSKVASAKEKVKCLKQKLQDEIAQALLSNVSISEHEARLSQIKSEIAEAQAELLLTKGTVPKSKQISDTMRIDPVFLDYNGQTFWKLKCYTAKYAVLLQDIKVHDVDGTATEEKWFVYDSEMKDEIDKYISSRTKALKVQKVPYIHYNESNVPQMCSEPFMEEAKIMKDSAIAGSI